MTTKSFLSSKINWAGIVTVALGAIPIIATFAKLLVPNAAIIIDGAATMVVGVLIVIWRTFYTNTSISTPPPDATLPKTQ
jgi:hypothetical protein